ncbi:MAG TPA: 50S ribosomal protein L4 [bacterium]|nr:50S ribosomal protein L4 [bacterium]HEX67443.1 50S ribosomal protein L4 [bacterium]
MVELPVYNPEGKEVGKIEVKEELFAYPPRPHVVWEYVRMYLANQRQGTASTKTRGEVRGGGAKPWPQKHTGRARAGSIRSPLWRGGGIIFGPKPRDYHYTIPKKKKRIAFYSVLSSLREEGRIKVLEELPVKDGKTKEVEKVLKNLKVDEKVLLVLDKAPEIVRRAIKNLENVRLRDPICLNPYDLLTCDWAVFTKDAIKKLEEVRV